MGQFVIFNGVRGAGILFFFRNSLLSFARKNDFCPHCFPPCFKRQLSVVYFLFSASLFTRHARYSRLQHAHTHTLTRNALRILSKINRIECTRTWPKCVRRTDNGCVSHFKAIQILADLFLVHSHTRQRQKGMEMVLFAMRLPCKSRAIEKRSQKAFAISSKTVCSAIKYEAIIAHSHSHVNHAHL